MTMTRERPPERVCRAFGVAAEDLEPVDGEAGWRGGGVLLRPATDPAEAVWAGQALAKLALPDLQVARPSQATDGRSIVAGWMAYRSSADAGVDQPPVDEIVLASVKLHQALAELPRPDFIDKRNDVLARADRVAWGEEEAELDEARGGRWFEILLPVARPTSLPSQVVHGNLFSSVRYTTDGQPAVVDFRPYYRPAEWATALVVIDAVVADAAGAALLDRWAHLPEWRQMLLRATLFRLAGNAIDPAGDEQIMDGLRRAAVLVGDAG